MATSVSDLYSDMAPGEGRAALTTFIGKSSGKQLTWQVGGWSLGGVISGRGQSVERSMRLQGSIEPSDLFNPVEGWAELELSGSAPAVIDLILAGTRPLPQANLTCICRHPWNRDCLAAGTSDAQLLLLDARMEANLKVKHSIKLESSFSSLVCCGSRLLGLESSSGRRLHLIDVAQTKPEQTVPRQTGQVLLPVTLCALAENDAYSIWGLSTKGTVYRIEVPDLPLPVQPMSLTPDQGLGRAGSLRRRKLVAFQLSERVRSIYRSLKARKFPRLIHFVDGGAFAGLSYDGANFWTFRRARQLLLYNREHRMIRFFAPHPEVSISYISYTHKYLLVLDLKHQQLHQYYLADNLVPKAALKSRACRHSGFLPAGTASSGRIHNLCLLYAGGEGQNGVHRYDGDKLLPLAAYLTRQREIADYFMDGFLLLAQYSPLLNGRCLGLDLGGPPSRREDWLALFDEYFYPRANLHALENCARGIERCLDKRGLIRVVLGIPTADPRCRDWDNTGYSLSEEAHRLEVTRWAIDELLQRWKKASFRRLALAGFYYLTEQGAFNDPLLSLFPQLCSERGLCSYAIPGISSSYLTEFNRVGFDCVALQSSHSFWRPIGRPRRYLLKCAGHIARDFGMGMEVELPYNVLEPEGAQKLRDYLETAHIQGWSGAFKAYFQSYNLIKSLADSPIPEYRQLYDELYKMSRLSHQPQTAHYPSKKAIAVDWHARWSGSARKDYFRINIEGNQGNFKLRSLSLE